MIENDPITISDNDINEANQLSLHCPICADSVERHPNADAMKPVVCAKCGTLYHKACWAQAGGKCAILGCGSKEQYLFGQDFGNLVKITYDDLPKKGRPQPSLNGRNKRLKREEKQRNEGWWSKLFKRLLQAIKILE